MPYDVIVLTETWLNEDFLTSEIFDCNFYNVFRKDRCTKTTGLKRGGGVLIAIRSNISVNSYALTVNTAIDSDQVIVKLKLHNSELFVIASYIPPKSSTEAYNVHLNNAQLLIENLSPTQHVLLVGDFNLGSIIWNNARANTFTADTDSELLLLEFISQNNLCQVNNILNDNNRLLDLVFISEYLTYKICNPFDNIFNKSFHHSPILIELDIIHFEKTVHDTDVYTFDFKKADFIALNNHLFSLNWNDIFYNMDLNAMYESFLNILQSAMYRYIPRKRIYKNNNPAWFNKRLSNLKNKKNKIYKKYRADKQNPNLESSYFKIANEFEVLNKFLHRGYLNSIENDLKSNSKFFWTYINKKRKTTGFPKCMSFNNESSEDTSKICKWFESYFKSVYSNTTANPLNRMNMNTPIVEISNINVTDSDVELALLSLDSNVKLGPDGIAPIVLKNCSLSLSLPLCVIFNKSLSLGQFLSQWKVSEILPTYKSGCKQDITNYRPISKLLIIPKLFEKIVCDKVSPIVNNFLSDDQHGFRPGLSTTTNLAVFSNLVNLNLNSNCQTDVIYTDFSKAFDKVNHSILLDKLESFGINANLLLWFCSYLVGRSQYVRFNNTMSDLFNVTSGVPQGSHLGPVLFNIFINDLPSVIKYSNCLLFADDLKLLRKICDPSDSQLLQHDIDSVSDWCRNNLLDLNIKKCNFVSFTRSNTLIPFQYNINCFPLESLEMVKDLGIIFDKKFSFKEHISHIFSKSMRLLGFIKRNSLEFRDPSTIKSLYVSLVRPYLEYCSIIWNPSLKVDIVKLERVQKNFTRFLFFKLNWRIEKPPYYTRCCLFDICSLERRRELYAIVFIRDLVHHHIKCCNLISLLNFYSPFRTLRECFHFRLPVLKSNIAFNNPIYRCMFITNKIINLIDIFENVPRLVFKKNIVIVLDQFYRS